MMEREHFGVNEGLIEIKIQKRWSKGTKTFSVELLVSFEETCLIEAS